MKKFFQKSLIPVFPWLILVYLILFTYVAFSLTPNYGFMLQNGRVVRVFDDYPTSIGVQENDEVISMNGIHKDEIESDLYKSWFSRIWSFSKVEIAYERNGEVFEEQILVLPMNLNSEVFQFMLFSQWWFAFAFWFAGLVTYLNFRPKTIPWRVLVSFLFLCSIWLMASVISNTHLWGSAILLRIGIFLTAPVFIHLHWVFPNPLNSKTETPSWLKFFYILSIAFSILQIFQFIPSGFYGLILLLSVLVSLGLIFFRLLKFKNQRVSYRAIAFLTFVSILPGLIFGFAGLFGLKLEFPLTSLTPLALPLIPIAYLYSFNRKYLGNLEYRLNKFISGYVYIVISGIILIITYLILSVKLQFQVAMTLTTLLISLIALIFTISIYSKFQNFIEEKILGVNTGSKSLLSDFSNSMMNNLDKDQFYPLINRLVLNPLFIRESCLFEYEGDKLIPIFQHGLEIDQNWIENNKTALQSNHNKFINEPSALEFSGAQTHIKLIFDLKFEGEILGYWLLGKRDPEDFYSLGDIHLLQTIAEQISLAIKNQQLSSRLRSLYQQNIDRHESERASIARELHDETLNMLALIIQESHQASVIETTEKTISSLREIIQGLRPELLAYGGLATALEDLGDQLAERQSKVRIISNISSEGQFEIDSHVELHLFRIAQQACENALLHSKAKTIEINGKVSNSKINIEIKDDGIGFQQSDLDFSHLLLNRHYGLAGMHERASLIHAKISIHSVLNLGTSVKVNWQK